MTESPVSCVNTASFYQQRDKPFLDLLSQHGKSGGEASSRQSECALCSVFDPDSQLWIICFYANYAQLHACILRTASAWLCTVVLKDSPSYAAFKHHLSFFICFNYCFLWCFQNFSYKNFTSCTQRHFVSCQILRELEKTSSQ